jgi:serine/threonine-protein kinase
MTPVLDELLYVDKAGCAARLAQIRSEDPALADDVAYFLAQRTGIASDDFLGGHALDLVVDASGGEAVGNYTLERELGQGGMGTVWLARRNDGRYEGKVAIKFLDAPRFELGAIERFRREGSVLARLAHPNIARLIDAGVTERGQPYLVLEYVDGEQIDHWCSTRALGTRERVRLFREVLAAVAHAHRKLILHRDLKPSNILVTSDGHVKLLDFGIAKLLDEGATETTALTQPAGRALTPDYASPEQILRQPLSVASDVYSLGVVLYELLCGRRPYELKHDSLGCLEDAIVTADASPPSNAAGAPAQRRALAGDIDTIVLKALKKAPADRYATVNELLDDLDRHLDGLPVRARADSLWYRARKFVARNGVAVGAVTGIALALIVGGGVAVWQAGVARSEAKRAREINRFVVTLFDSADPWRGAHSDVRAVDLLKQARVRIETDLEGRPDLQVELLATVGKSLSGLASYQEAQETLQRALEIAASDGSIASSPPAEEAAIELIEVLVTRGDNAAAEELLSRCETALQGRTIALPCTLAR